MSRFFKVMIVLLAIAAFAAPVMAADNFSVSGNLYEYGFYTDDDSDSTHTFVYQKLRIYGIFKANENVNVQFRTDMTEGLWGADYGHGRFGGNRGATLADLDRAFADISFDTLKLRVGQQYVAFGSTQAFIYNDFGATVNIKGDVPVTLTYALLDDNDAANGSAADRFIAGANVNLAGFSLYAGVDQDQAKEVYLLGANYKAKYDGGIAVNAELNFFTGDATANTDAEGLTAFADVSMAVSEAATVGGALYYAAGNDDADEAYTMIGNGFGVWDAFTRGPFADESYLMVSRPFDIFGNEAGVVAVQVYADVKASDALMVGATLAYAEPDEDSVTTADSKMIFSAYATYALLANVDWYNGVQYVDTDETDASKTDSELSIGSGLNIKF